MPTEPPGDPGETASLAPGARLLHYEILGVIGAGGMGQVWRARDVRLGRLVAVKTLPRLGQHVSAQARFEREARVVAGISHANIVALYDAGEVDGVSFLVMELLEGETLEHRLRRGPVPTGEALGIARAVARGLAAAHERGVVHRDIKPANLFLTRDGVPKILDFGLARVAEIRSDAATVGFDGAADPVDAAPLSRVGAVLGTPGYMAPEQARGDVADVRTDLFSLGAVLYEMLEGRRAFPGKSLFEAIHALGQPGPPSFGPTTPAPVRTIVTRCLEKDRDKRFQSAKGLCEALDALGAVEAAVPSPPATKMPDPRRWPWVITLPLVGLVGGGLGWILHAPALMEGIEIHRLTHQRGYVHSALFTPDGASVLYSGRFRGGATEVNSVTLSTGQSVPLDVGEAVVLAVRPEEMLLLEAPSAWLIYQPGSLSSVGYTGDSPRKVAESVVWADSRGGSRALGGVDHVEFPETVRRLHGRTLGGRLDKEGRRLALFLIEASGASIEVLDRDADAEHARRRYPRSPNAAAESGLAWAPDGSLWVSMSDKRGGSTLGAYAADGSYREIFRSLDQLALQDIAPDGKLLVYSFESRWELATAAGAGAGRDLDWRGGSAVNRISDDGLTLLVSERKGSGPFNPVVALLTLNDRVRQVNLGAGLALDVSDDGSEVLARVGEKLDQLSILSVTSGPPRAVPAGEWTAVSCAWFLPTAGEILVSGDAPGSVGATETGGYWVVDRVTGVGRRVAAPGFNPECWQDPVSPDGGWIATGPDGEGRGALLPVAGGEAWPILGLQPGDSIVRWTGDGLALLVVRRQQLPARLERLDLTTGARALIANLEPDDRTGFVGVQRVVASADGGRHAFTYQRMESNLYVVSGLR